MIPVQASRNRATRADRRLRRNSILSIAAGLLVGSLGAIGPGRICPPGLALAQEALVNSDTSSPAATTTPSPPGASIRKSRAENSAAPVDATPAASEHLGDSNKSSPAAAVGDVKTDARDKAASKKGAKGKAKGGSHERNAEHAIAKADSSATGSSLKDGENGKDKDNPFSSLQFSNSKGPIDIKSDSLDLDYKGNTVTFRGHVRAVQADAILTSDSLVVRYAGKDFHELKEMVADSNVRMSQGSRWATGDRAVLDQTKHTVTLTGNPVVHDGEDQVAGSKITVHLDSGRSEVEGARAVIFPKDQKTRDNKTTVAKTP